MLLALSLAAAAKPLPAQVEAPQTVAAARATVADPTAWGTAENPALAPGAPLAVRAYGHHQLELAGLERFGLDVGFSRGAMGFTAGLQAFAPPGYSAYGLHLGASRVLGERLRGGVRLGLVRRDLDEYGRQTLPMGQVGIRYEVTPRLAAGAHYAYVEPAVAPLGEHRLRVGIDYASSTRVHLLLAAWQVAGARVGGGASVRFDAADRLRLRAGVQGGGAAFTLGVDGELRGGLRVGVALAVYQTLPPGTSAGVRWEGVGGGAAE